MFSLEGKVAIITGSTRGIGLGIAEAFLAQGARVVISSESASDTAEAAARLGTTGIACDVTRAEDLAALVDSAHGGIDILVCNAGITDRRGDSSASGQPGRRFRHRPQFRCRWRDSGNRRGLNSGKLRA